MTKQSKKEIAERCKRYNESHREEIKKWKHENYLKHRDEIYQKHRVWHNKNKDAVARWHQDYNRRGMKNYYSKRFQVLTLYGGNPPVCQCCGEKEMTVLTIDHFDLEQGKRDARSNIITVTNRLLKENDPSKYQVLCLNCNFAKFRYGGCPHRYPEKSPWRRLQIA